MPTPRQQHKKKYDIGGLQKANARSQATAPPVVTRAAAAMAAPAQAETGAGLVINAGGDGIALDDDSNATQKSDKNKYFLEFINTRRY